jgi:hypothetical protein
MGVPFQGDGSASRLWADGQSVFILQDRRIIRIARPLPSAP